MFKSGFFIFLITKDNLVTLHNNSPSLSILYKQIVINNKINLINNTYKIFNMNSLRYIMIKLGIIYRELYLIEKGMEGLENYDLKTAHLLMQYILESSDIPQVVQNENDNFFIYMIRIATNYIIKLYSLRVGRLKLNDFSSVKMVKNTKFHEYFHKSKEFKEMVILTKYLDILRNLDNSIYFKRKIVDESLLEKVKNLNVRVQDKSVDSLDIAYYKNQLYTGKVSDSQNYVIQKISREVSSVNIMVLNKMLVELYCYSILQDSEKSLSLCINVLRNVSYNPNLFFKNIAIKTQKKALRNYLLTHLKHSNFTSSDDEKYFDLIHYIDEHYSNPSFNVEYNLKSTKILLQREFRKINFELLINKNYRLKGDGRRGDSDGGKGDYQTLLSKQLGGIVVDREKKKKVKKRDKYVSLEYSILQSSPLMTIQNLKTIEETTENKSYAVSGDYFDIYLNYFCNTEIDDFGMNKKRENIKKPHYLDTEYFNTLSTLFFKYFEEHDEKIYMLTNERHYKCILCRSLPGYSGDFTETNTNHLGYSNISIENLKYFDVSNIIRIHFDDYLQTETNIDRIIGKFNFNNLPHIRSIFYYIIGHYQIGLLIMFIDKLIASDFFKDHFLKGETIYTEYFCNDKSEFQYMNDNGEIFSRIENSYIGEIIFNNFIGNGILVKDFDVIDGTMLRDLTKRDLLKFPERTYFKHYELTEEDDIKEFIKGEVYEVKNSLVRNSLLDEKMDEFILNTRDNHYLLQTFLDFNLINPKSIYYRYQDKLNTWQKVILLSKFNTTDCIFEISIEIFNHLKQKSNHSADYYLLVFYGCLMYLKLDNIDYDYYIRNIPIPFLNSINHLSSKVLGNIFTEEASFDVDKDIPRVISDPNSQQYTNDIFTCNKDISIKQLISKYYKFLNKNDIKEWLNRSENYSLTLDDFEILIENGRVMDAYYYYKNNYNSLSDTDLEIFLYNICLNNLLNYNVFAATVTFLYLMEWENKGRDMIVRIEAANRILLYELNKLVRNKQLNYSVEEAIKKVKDKNYIFHERDYLGIDNEEKYDDMKMIIMVYKKLVSEFREFCQKGTTQENTIFQTLKRLEDATWDGKKDDLLYNSKEITLDSPWHLVFLFCKTHNYEMSLTLLHELGRNNNWIMFLHKAQDQECPPATVLKILDGYFSDSNLKRHLNIVIEGLLDKAEESIKDDYNSNNANEERVNRVDFGKYSFNDFIIYNIKPKQAKANQGQQIYDPLYYMTLADNNKCVNILNESLHINWKDLIIVSLINTNYDIETIFTTFSLYIYMSIKEIFITKNYLEEILRMFENGKHQGIGKTLIKNLKDIFEPKKKALKLYDVEILIKILLLNNHSSVLLEVLELFDIPFSFDEFVLFCKSFSENDFENAFVHLFIFKNSMFDFFKNRFSDDFISKAHDEEGIINNLNTEFTNSEIKTFDDLILVFFFQVANSVVGNFIDLYEADSFKLSKLLELLYLTKWNNRYSTYFKNMCILSHVKGKHNLNYKSSFDSIVEQLILQNSYSILSEYILSYEGNKVDDTLLYNIFSMISSFDKNYILYSDEERSHFWEWLESLLKEASFTSIQLAIFFLYILEAKEEKLYLKEQFTLIFKIYNYLIDSSESFVYDPTDRFVCFMRSVLNYSVDKGVKVENVKQDMKNRIIVIIFSSCQFKKLKSLFKDKECKDMGYIFEIYPVLINELKEESPVIHFSVICDSFWKLIGSKGQPKSPIDEGFTKTYNTVCTNLINLNQLDLILELSKYYEKDSIITTEYNKLTKYLIERFDDIKQIPIYELTQMLQDASNRTLKPAHSMLKTFPCLVRDKLEMQLYACLKQLPIEKIVLYELLKIIISVELDLHIDMFINFNENLETILYSLIDNTQNGYYIIDYLNKLIDNDELLAKTIIDKFFHDVESGVKQNIKLFNFIKFFKRPHKVGYIIQKHIINIDKIKDNKLHSNYWEIIFMGYYSFLIDCFHRELVYFNQLITSKIEVKNLFDNIFKLFSICEDEDRVKELFHCLYMILLRDMQRTKHISSTLLINSFNGTCSAIRVEDIFVRFRSEIQFYLKSKYYKKLGEIYVRLANDYSGLIKDKYAIRAKRYTEITRKEEELTILNFYIRGAEMFLLDNCIKNYEEIFNCINRLIKDNFKEDIDINLE
jgi:hypothetical protein